MKRRLASGLEARAMDINMAPLIDCVFLLLIFFIVTPVLVEQPGLDVALPRAMSAEQLETQAVVLGLDAGGAVYYAGQPLRLDQVRGLVARQLRQRPTPVIIMADERSQSGQLVALMDECKLAGAEQIALAADRQSRGPR